MGIFEDAYRDGLKAFADANAAKMEIAAVLDELTQQVGKASDGYIHIATGPEKKPPAGEAAPESPRSTIIAALGRWGIQRVIGYCTVSTRGYPVTLDIAGEELVCADRDALRKGLVQLLRHPETGGHIRWLIDNQNS